MILAIVSVWLAISAIKELGKQWSLQARLIEGHKLVTTGVYRIVRHPIYTGLLLALYATALDHGTIFALVGVLVLTIAFYVKARLEERFLSAELGPGYGQYERRVPMLVPLWPVRSA